ncbi:DgyrCDS7767 [Dimorphilus gyrociliatus]|uniref:3-hydroxy-3-methylglutaryl coenzyme A reductase n=1 Tax=Dimorphilus gyrociliatus TaxID=2664684 RepID=A0A7I8VUA6_9ANNE|nr:DgyrCDS7767 [Dimorphilus gyrociliatus]
MISKIFRAHGRLCTTHPWEVIIGTFTLTICIVSMCLFGFTDGICGWNCECPSEDIEKISDPLVLTVTRCVAVVYIYLKFQKLRKLGWKYLLGIAGLLTIFSSFVLSIAVIKLLEGDMKGLNEALPLFLLVIDLSKATTLAKFALKSSSQGEIKENISRGLAVIGPVVTLDAFVQVMLLGIGILSGVKQLEKICYFGCLAVIANYLAFMTFYPSALTLIMELGNGESLAENWKVPSKLLKHEEEKNPVAQRVKLIMSVGLVLVHTHSILAGNGLTAKEGVKRMKYKKPHLSLGTFYWKELTTFSPEFLVTAILAIILTIKYIWWDNDVKVSQEDEQDVILKQPSQPRFAIDEDSFKSAEIATQTDNDIIVSEEPVIQEAEKLPVIDNDLDPSVMSDVEVVNLVKSKSLPSYKLESALGDYERAVSIRRRILCEDIREEIVEKLPYRNLDYSLINGACCENVIGYMPVPVGTAGPLLLDGRNYHVPMATTEGCLVASTNRGCRALVKSGGVRSCVVNDGMSRAPVVRLSSANRAAQVKIWLEENVHVIGEEFESTSRFARLKKLQIIQAARYLYIRFVCQTGDAMGMNMISKGAEKALNFLRSKHFPDLEILSLSGNVCTDKKASAINWIEGRGKSVVCDAIIPSSVIKTVLKSSVEALCDLNVGKNLIGSAMAGTAVGGFNAHSSNIVTAIFIATGQDVAQNIASSNCLTLLEPHESGGLYISCTMPSIEVGTVGGGTILSAQKSCLEMLGVAGGGKQPGENSTELSKIVCATVLAGELSLMSALAAGHLVRSHMRHNRSNVALNSISNPTRCCGKLQ